MASRMWVALALVVSGCSSDPEAQPEEPSDVDIEVTATASTQASNASASSSAKNSAGSVSSPPPESTYKFASVRGVAIGERCESAEGPDCGLRGRTAIEHGQGPMRDLPCSPVVVGSKNQGNWRSACVSGDDLIVRSECVVCRLSVEQFQHARISELRPGQADALVKFLTLEGAAPTSAQEWRALIEKNKAP
ncbi:MAG: hypothetical protein U0271_43565 [Polyangiaceae bacterium]